MANYAIPPRLKWSTTTAVLIGKWPASRDYVYDLGTLSSDVTVNFASGGLDTGSIAASTWYYIYLVDSTGTLIGKASLAPPATGPSGYTSWLYVGAIRTNSSSQIIKFYHLGQNGRFSYGSPITNAALSTTSLQGPGDLRTVSDLLPPYVTGQAFWRLQGTQYQTGTTGRNTTGIWAEQHADTTTTGTILVSDSYWRTVQAGCSAQNRTYWQSRHDTAGTTAMPASATPKIGYRQTVTSGDSSHRPVPNSVEATGWTDVYSRSGSESYPGTEVPTIATESFLGHSFEVSIATESFLGHSFAVASPSASAPLLVHKFNVDRIDTVFGSIRPLKYRNQFDELGDIVSLRRLPEETNWEYRRRIQDAMVNYANSSYRGMIHGVTRELGLALYDSILINPKVDSGGRFLAPDPYIRFEGPYLYLYSDYANNMLDWAIDRYESGGNYEHVGRLVEMVNNTSFFEAGLPYNIDYYTRSMTLLNQSNRRIVSFERVPASTVFTLKHDRVIRGSLFFSNRTNFRTEVASEDLVLSAGQYYVDYHSGTVKVFTIGTISDIVRYQYVEYPFVALASPVIIHDVTNENFRTKMFNQVLQDDGTYTHGLPTELGVDIINELLSVIPMYFGV